MGGFFPSTGAGCRQNPLCLFGKYGPCVDDVGWLTGLTFTFEWWLCSIAMLNHQRLSGKKYWENVGINFCGDILGNRVLEQINLVKCRRRFEE